MKYIILKSGIFLIGLLGIGLATIIRFDYNWQKRWILDVDIIYPTDIYGDLYQLNLIDNFRIPVDPRIDQYQFNEKHPAIEEADLFVFGDSFLDHPRQKGIPELIMDSLGLKVFYESHYLSPLYMVDLIGVNKSKRRVIIMEVVERYLSTIDITPPDKEEIVKDHHKQESNSTNIYDGMGKYIDPITMFIFPKNPDKSYEFLFKRAKYLNRINSWINTLRFNYFGYMNEMTPVFSKSPPFLFYHETVDDSKYSYFHFHSDDEVEKIADNIEFIRNYLLENYNLDFVLFPIPNKMTIHHDLVTDIPYDNFLPRVYRELEWRDIPVIKIYNEFKNSSEVLYYPTDTHWNTRGMNIGYQNTIEKLKELSVLNN